MLLSAVPKPSQRHRTYTIHHNKHSHLLRLRLQHYAILFVRDLGLTIEI